MELRFQWRLLFPDNENDIDMKTSRDSPKSCKKVSTPEVRRAENVPSGMQIKEGVDHKVIENLTSLPTVFEGKTAEKTRKFSTREHWSNIGEC